MLLLGLDHLVVRTLHLLDRIEQLPDAQGAHRAWQAAGSRRAARVNAAQAQVRAERAAGRALRGSRGSGRAPYHLVWRWPKPRPARPVQQRSGGSGPLRGGGREEDIKYKDGDSLALYALRDGGGSPLLMARSSFVRASCASASARSANLLRVYLQTILGSKGWLVFKVYFVEGLRAERSPSGNLSLTQHIKPFFEPLLPS
eukprot:scaffold6976_cov118-Isochrysis_galbana.AAC.8